MKVHNHSSDQESDGDPTEVAHADIIHTDYSRMSECLTMPSAELSKVAPSKRSRKFFINSVFEMTRMCSFGASCIPIIRVEYDMRTWAPFRMTMNAPAVQVMGCTAERTNYLLRLGLDTAPLHPDDVESRIARAFTARRNRELRYSFRGRYLRAISDSSLYAHESPDPQSVSQRDDSSLIKRQRRIRLEPHELQATQRGPWTGHYARPYDPQTLQRYEVFTATELTDYDINITAGVFARTVYLADIVSSEEVITWRNSESVLSSVAQKVASAIPSTSLTDSGYYNPRVLPQHRYERIGEGLNARPSRPRLLDNIHTPAITKSTMGNARFLHDSHDYRQLSICEGLSGESTHPTGLEEYSGKPFEVSHLDDGTVSISLHTLGVGDSFLPLDRLVGLVGPDSDVLMTPDGRHIKAILPACTESIYDHADQEISCTHSHTDVSDVHELCPTADIVPFPDALLEQLPAVDTSESDDEADGP